MPFVAFIAAPPVGPFCFPGEEGMYWYKAQSLGAALSFLICFSSVILSRIALGFGYERVARHFMFVPLIGLAAYWLLAAGLRAYWGESIQCLWTMSFTPA